MTTVRMLDAESILAPYAHIGGKKNPDMQWLEVLERPAVSAPRRPWGAACWQEPKRGRIPPTGCQTRRSQQDSPSDSASCQQTGM